MALLFSVFLCVCAGAFAFNVDIESRVVYKGNQESMFGFTVQSHIDGDQKMILVGAPEDQPPFSPLKRPGSVYKCRVGFSNCDIMVFDRNGTNSVDSSNRQIDQKDRQWFGATLTSTGRNGNIVACAPRYVSYVTPAMGQRDPVGSCFVKRSSDSQEALEYSPCRMSNHGDRKTGVCQAGFSAAVSKDGQRLFMGAPGSFYWQGVTFSINARHRFNEFYMKKMHKGQLYEHIPGDPPNILSTVEATDAKKYDDSYMGYSMTVGDFGGTGIQGVAVGVPRGSNLMGLVVLYTWELQNIRNISGSQIGAYFGYSLASGDIDGDGTDDVIIGAPMYTRKTDGYEHGCIYVVYQGKDEGTKFTRNHARVGEVSKGRFGLALTSLGDINHDGFGDIAVGAPYGGKDGRGVVYIYQGSKEGIREKYSQSITAEEVAPGLTTFGFSLSGGVDLDDNKYTDLAVGAYKSDTVVFLKSRPVVKVMAEVHFMGESKVISMTNKTCPLPDGRMVSCAPIKFCLTYDGINVNQQINFIVSLDLDSRQTNTKRLFVLRDGRETNYTTHVMLAQRQHECKEVTVYLDDEIRDKLTPIDVKMTYALAPQHARRGSVPPILDLSQNIERTDSINILRNCGPDNICDPHLRLVVTSPTVNYMLGSSELVFLDVKVENAGEDAFEATYYLPIPAGVTYAKMERLDKDNKDAGPVFCSVKNTDGNHTLICELGNPMHTGQQVKFRVVLEVSPMARVLDFSMVANSTNPQKTFYSDNRFRKQIGVIARANLDLIGTSDPPELHYNASLYSASSSQDTKLGPQIIHKYKIKNEGPYDMEEATVHIMWPYQTLNGENFMYMLVQPETAGNIQCDLARNINPANLTLGDEHTFFLFKEIEAMIKNKVYYQVSHSRARFTEQIGIDSLHQNPYRPGNTNAPNPGVRPGWHKEESSSSTSSHSSWEELSADEQKIVKQNLAAVAQTHGSGGYTRRGYEETKSFWETLTEEERDIIMRNFENEQEVFTAAEQEHIRQVLVGSFLRNHAQGYGNGGQITRVRNKTIIYDANHNIISQSESSTEYGSLGHEGEAGSSFNKYGQGRYDQAHSQGGSQSGYASQGSGYQTQGSGYHSQGSGYQTQGSGYQNQGSGYQNQGSSYQNQGSGYQNQGSGYQNQGSGYQNRGSGQGFVHGDWVTTESVNHDLENAKSSTFSGGLTVVGDDDDKIGGIGAYAAQGSNNEFKFGLADVTNADTSSSGSRGQGGSFQSGGSGHQSGGSSYHQGSGGSYQASSSGSASSQNGGGYRTGGGYSYSSSSSSSSHSGGRAYNADGSYVRQDNARRRRQISVDPELEKILENCEEKYRCAAVQCTIGQLRKGQEVWLALRSRINATVLNEISKDRAVKLSSLVATRVTRLPLVGDPTQQSWKQVQAVTVVTPQLEVLESGGIPLWVVVLAAVAGALLLLLLIFALYKCGFFKRNRPSDQAERQPLKGRDEPL